MTKGHKLRRSLTVLGWLYIGFSVFIFLALLFQAAYSYIFEGYGYKERLLAAPWTLLMWPIGFLLGPVYHTDTPAPIALIIAILLFAWAAVGWWILISGCSRWFRRRRTD